MALPPINNYSTSGYLKQEREGMKNYSRQMIEKPSNEYNEGFKEMAHIMQSAIKGTDKERAQLLKSMSYVKKIIDTEIADKREKEVLNDTYKRTVKALELTSSKFDSVTDTFVKQIGNISGAFTAIFSDMPPIFSVLATRGGDFISKKIQERKELKEKGDELKNRIDDAKSNDASKKSEEVAKKSIGEIEDVAETAKKEIRKPGLSNLGVKKGKKRKNVVLANTSTPKVNPYADETVKQEDLKDEKAPDNKMQIPLIKQIGSSIGMTIAKSLSAGGKVVGGLLKALLFIPLISLAGYAFKKIKDNWEEISESLKETAGNIISSILDTFSIELSSILLGIVALLNPLKTLKVAKSAGTAVVKGAQTATKAVTKGAQTATKVAGKEVAKEASEKAIKETAEAAAKQGAELVAKQGGKSLLKKLPLGAGLIFAGTLAADRISDGDFIGAGMELFSGFASIFPVVGTAVSVATDAALLAKDISDISKENQQSILEQNEMLEKAELDKANGMYNNVANVSNNMPVVNNITNNTTNVNNIPIAMSDGWGSVAAGVR